MKSLIRITAIVFLFTAFTAAAYAGHPKKTKKEPAAAPETPTVCLEVAGIALDSAEQPINGVSVKLYRENDELEWTEVTSVDYHDHMFSFKLNVNEYYTIEVSKNGYVTRSVAISTMLPPAVSLKQLFHYEFEVQLFKENKAMDDYYLDFPVALVSYNAKSDVFDNNANYTKHIKTKIKEATVANCSMIGKK
ncbi:MAG: hypothetical protein JWP12_2070 [Bacteroidetes bacterium]|nr:hypothetical protein [Bacteroidota bacterium]